MVNKIIFDDEIVLFWDRDKDFEKGFSYKIFFGKNVGETPTTHFRIGRNDIGESSFLVKIELTDASGKIIKNLFTETLAFAQKKNRIDISKAPYNAIGDGKSPNTKIIQKAIDDCGKNDCVYIPEGVFLTGALKLHSDMELYVDKNAVLLGSESAEDYLPKIKSRFEGIEKNCYQSLLNLGELDSKGGYTSHNVVIRGGGAVLGGGRKLEIDEIEKESGLPFNETGVKTEKEKTGWTCRGRLLHVCNAENVIVANVTIGEAAAWNLHFIYSKNIVTYGCTIRSTNVNNGDGWDPDSSEDCTIFDCDFNTRDDMIAIKSGKNPEGNIINRPSKNIKIFDCRCEHGHGLAVGSEMSGGVEQVYIWDCQMENSRCGLEIKGMEERGGYVKNVVAYNSGFSILAIRSVEYNKGGQSADTPPVFKDFYFEDITLTGICVLHNGERRSESAIILHGFNQKGYELKNVTLKNVFVKKCTDDGKQTVSVSACKNVTIDNLICE